jgi:hypothetical protein
MKLRAPYNAWNFLTARKHSGFYISALLYGVDKLKYRKETAHNIKPFKQQANYLKAEVFKLK